MEMQATACPPDRLAALKFMIKHGFLKGDESPMEVFEIQGKILAKLQAELSERLKDIVHGRKLAELSEDERERVNAAWREEWPKDWMTLSPDRLAALKALVTQ
jgi:hypothetical protein